MKPRSMWATKGYDVQFGARPLKRAIQNHIEDGLSELILSGEIKAGDTIKISKEKDNDKLKFDTSTNRITAKSGSYISPHLCSISS